MTTSSFGDSFGGNFGNSFTPSTPDTTGVLGGYPSMLGVWMGGVSGFEFVPPSGLSGFRSMLGIWMGGVDAPPGGPPPPGGGQPPWAGFICNMGRMMTRRGG